MNMHKNNLEASLKEMSGLQQLQRMIETNQRPPISETMDFNISEVSFGKVLFEGEPQKMHLNPIGSIHGGYAATLLDSALGCSIHSVLEPGEGYTTVDLNIKYLRGLKPGMGKVTAIAEVVHKGRRIATADAKLVGEDGKIYATGNTTCAIL